jgi:NADPH-dependent 2,4-dienoyl-CoA reductase/sulfur reductase-like enzyme
LSRGPASVSAAETLRAEGAKGSILLVSEEDCVPYGHSHLSKRFLLGAQPKERLLIHSEAYYRDHAIELMFGTLAVAVDSTNRLVRTDHAGDIHFDKLLIATGAKPRPGGAGSTAAAMNPRTLRPRPRLASLLPGAPPSIPTAVIHAAG